MKTSKIIAAALAFIIPSALCFTGCGFYSFFNYTYENADKYTAGNREISDKITTVNIDYVSGDVKFIGTDTDKVTVKETSNKELTEEQKVHTWVDGETLYVRYCASTKKISFFKIDKSLEIKVPGIQDLEDVTVHISSGNLNCSGITAESMNIQSSSGSLDIGCSVSDIMIKASSGNIKLDQNGDSNSIDIHSSSGYVRLGQTGSTGTVKLHSSSGDVDAVLDKVSDLDIHASSGNISVEANEVSKLDSNSSSGKNVFKLGSVPADTRIHSSSGGVKVYLPEDAGVTVSPYISSGDFNYELAFSKNGKEYVNGDGSAKMKIDVSSGNVDILKW